LASRLIAKLEPRVLAMCGVCAGHPDDTDLGDVVIADRVYQYDSGKLTTKGFKGDLRTHLPDDRWVHAAQDLANKPAAGLHGYAEPDLDESPWWFLERLVTKRDPRKSAFSRYFPDDRRAAMLGSLREGGLVRLTSGRFSVTKAGRTALLDRRAMHGAGVTTRPYHVLVGPMGSGNAVVADGGVWARLAEMGERRILAVEQEAAAIGAVAYRCGLRFLVAKGVMDHADKHNNDWANPFAARASAEVLCSFLRRVIEPGQQTADPPERSAKFEGPTRERRFTGRDDELANLERLISKNQSVCVVATGIGGIGKTTLVSEFVVRRGRALFPDGVAWIDGSPERFAGELARVSERFGWPTSEMGRSPTSEEAVDWLERTLPDKRVLCVVDNLDPKRSKPKHVPIPGRNARTIVTSRTRTLDEDLHAARLVLGAWAPKVCRAYLRDNCREDCPWVTTASDAHLDDLAKFVVHLPLGMRLLVSVLRRQSHLSPAELLPLLRAQPLGTLDEFDQERGVAATFRFAYDALREPERRVLQALAACARQTRAEVVAAVADAELAPVRASLGDLSTHGFAEQPEQGVWSLHDVVRMFVLEQPGAEEFERRHLDWVLRHLEEHADPTAYREFAEGVEEATHAFARWLGRDLDAAKVVYSLLGRHLKMVGRYADAVQLSELLLAVASSDSAEAAVALRNLGLCYLTLGDIPKAIEYHERSLAIEEKLGRLEGQANAFGNLGLRYRRLGDIPKAIEYHERSLAIEEKLGRLEGQANQLGNLGGCYLTPGDIPKAIEYLERSLAINEKLGRIEGQANQLCNLGLCYEQLGQLPTAVDFLTRARELYGRMGLPADHPSIAIVERALARLR
jgi:tetratricopeptide (TPR) repeat protein/nucleoside phosphorylase